nr:hypothetical protein Iba_chr01bCG9070 [Ipomoea batatas]
MWAHMPHEEMPTLKKDQVSTYLSTYATELLIMDITFPFSCSIPCITSYKEFLRKEKDLFK